MTPPQAGAAPVPFTLVAELTHRCPLRCLYCSNPTRLSARELTTASWKRVFAEAAALGVLQVHLTGGEPLLRRDLEELVAAARAAELYVNLVTSGVPLTQAKLAALAGAGLDHVQLSLQATNARDAAEFAGRDVFEHKLCVARWTKELGLPLTVNFVLHRDNIDDIAAMIELARLLGAERVELANAQYLGWAFENRARLLPFATQIAHARAAVEAARQGFTDLVIDFVLPDYVAARPRACMDGWARRYVVVSPDGRVLPCHAASAIVELEFDNVERGTLGEIWASSPALERFRTPARLSPTCQTCPELERDHGGCRCQAYVLTGNLEAVDPACARSPHHELVRTAREGLVPLRVRGSALAVG